MNIHNIKTAVPDNTGLCKEPVNILFLGGAKRVTMARMFIESAARLGREARIFSYELSEIVPVAACATVIVGRKWRDPELMTHLAEVIRRHSISIVIPFVDGAVEIAARLAENYGVYAPVGEARGAVAMFDKIQADILFMQAGLPLPEKPGDTFPDFPLIAKPRFGSASKGLLMIDTQQQFDHLSGKVDDYLIQRRYDKREEYTVDCFRSLTSGRILAVSPRKRVEVLGGEAVRTVTFQSPEVEALACRVINGINLMGAVTVQMLRDVDGGRIMVMEVNPRLGGGAVCSVYAGADIPSLILEDALGFESLPRIAQTEVEITRYFAETVFKKGKLMS